MRRLFVLPLTVALAVTSLSCGSNAPIALPESGASLEGTVTYGNDQVMFGLIIVQTANGSATGRIDWQTGKYHVENVPLGEVKIAVNTDAGQGDFMTAANQAGRNVGPDSKGGGRPNLKKVDVPKKYQDATTSGLSKTIEKGVNTYNIEIKK